jgi:transcriptional regulator with XRE-family HTH domain
MNSKQLGEFVKEERLRQQMTQKDLADKLQRKRRQAVIEVEQDQCDYGISVLIGILAALGYELVPHRIGLQPLTSFDFSKIESATEPLEIPKKKRTFASHKPNK